MLNRNLGTNVNHDVRVFWDVARNATLTQSLVKGFKFVNGPLVSGQTMQGSYAMGPTVTLEIDKPID